MLSIDMKSGKIILFLLYFFHGITTLEDDLENKYYFQLYPSNNDGNSYLFHAYTPDKKLITINSTEREDCQKIKEENVNEYPIKGLSSVVSFNKSLLIKTCFAPDKIVEIINEKNETFSYKNNNYNSGSQNLDNIKYCYSTSIIDPEMKNEYAIMTYWTEFKLENGKEEYTHKAILFHPKKKDFTSVTLVHERTLIEKIKFKIV